MTAHKNTRRDLSINFSVIAIIAFLLITGCTADFPNGSEEEGTELTLASRIEHEARSVRVNSLVNTVVWDERSNQLQVNGITRANRPISILNAATGQAVGSISVNAIAGDDDDDDAPVSQLVLRNLAVVPCSVRIQVGDRIQNVNVVNAPRNCSGIANLPVGNALVITKATWRNSSNKLVVKGNGADPRQLVSVFDGITGQLLGTDQSNSVGTWKLKIRNLFVAPCFVSVVSGIKSSMIPVNNASNNCSATPGSVPNNNSPFNLAPEGTIAGPISDMTISLNSTVNFIGTGFDPDSNNEVRYLWDFDGAADPSTEQVQSVRFTNAGVYRVTFTVVDNEGLADATPATRLISVLPAVGSAGNAAPNGSITSPVGNTIVRAGEPVNFTGFGTDPDGGAVNYLWNFGGGAPNSNAQNPVGVIFQTPGIYAVSLLITDRSGLADPSPDVKIITVLSGTTNPNSPTNSAPNGEILSPASDLVINVNDSVNFTGLAFDLDNNNPLKYRWDFGTAAPKSKLQNAGPITFDVPGVYTVSFTVTDALEMADFTPAIRVITVLGNISESNLEPIGNITLPTSNLTISAGQSVRFMGSGFDPDNNSPLSYMWSFGGANNNSTLQNPGDIMFNNPGTYHVSLTVKDSLGLADRTPALRIITVLSSNGSVVNPNQNLAPESQILNPPSNIVVQLNQSVNFAGMGSDPEGNSPLIYHWDFDNAAPNSFVQNPGSLVFSRPGSYLVTLAVQDAFGNMDKSPAVRIVTVIDPNQAQNQAPVGAIVSPASNVEVAAGQSVVFSGAATDPDGNTQFEYFWNFDGAVANSQLQTPGQVVFNEAGIYKVMLYVRDNAGYLDQTPEVRFITVTGSTNNNQAPNATILAPTTNVTINSGDSVLFSGIGEDFDSQGVNLMYSWDFGGAAAGSSQATPGLVRFDQPGVYQVSFTVMDNFGLSDPTPSTRTIIVRDVTDNNIAPTVNISSPEIERTTISVGESVFFAASGSDANNEAINYFWSFDGAAPDSHQQNPGNIFFTAPGIFHVSLVGVDARFKPSNVVTRTIEVLGSGNFSTNAPDGIIVTPISNMTVTVGDTVSFVGSARDGGNNIPFTYRWDFNGIAPSSFSQNPGNVIFDKVGVYTVALTVADSTGATDASPATRVITVLPQTSFPGGGFGNGNGNGFGNQMPNGDITSPTASVVSIAPGGSVFFAATGSDPDGDQLNYHWQFGGGMQDKFGANVGQVVFNTPGAYNVRLTVTDSRGLSDNTPDVVTVIVTGGVGTPFGGGGELNGFINSPTDSMIIARGQSVSFSGTAVDPNGDTTISYNWDFSGAAASSNLQEPGIVTFNEPGKYVISLTVTNSSGVTDQSPAVRVITVLP